MSMGAVGGGEGEGEGGGREMVVEEGERMSEHQLLMRLMCDSNSARPQR